MLRDGYGIVQCIIEKSHVGDDSFNLFKTFTQESSVSIIGTVVKNDRAPGGYEIFVNSFNLYLYNPKHLFARPKTYLQT